MQQGLAAMLVSPYPAFGVLMCAVAVAAVQRIGLLCPHLAAKRLWRGTYTAPEGADLSAAMMPFAE